MEKPPWDHKLRPLFVDIDVTSYCNLDCSMCFRKGLKDLEFKHMDFKTFQKALNGVNPQSGVVFIGLGEPLLHPNFLDMLIEVKKRKLSCNMATNGVLMDEKWAENIVKLKIDKVSISLDGATKETYETIRKGASFDKVISNIKTLVKIKKELKSDFPFIRLDMVGMRQNIKELPMLILLAKELGADGINMLHLQPLTKELSEQHLHTMPKEEVEKIFRKAREHAIKFNIDMRLRPLEPHRVGCYSPWTNPYIDIDGNVNACCLPGSEKIKCKEYYLGTEVIMDPKKLQFGNILIQEFKDIWFNIKYEQFRAFMYHMQIENKEKKWDRESYLELRRKNPDPPNYCLVCARRFETVC